MWHTMLMFDDVCRCLPPKEINWIFEHLDKHYLSFFVYFCAWYLALPLYMWPCCLKNIIEVVSLLTLSGIKRRTSLLKLYLLWKSCYKILGSYWCWPLAWVHVQYRQNGTIKSAICRPTSRGWNLARKMTPINHSRVPMPTAVYSTICGVKVVTSILTLRITPNATFTYICQSALW